MKRYTISEKQRGELAVLGLSKKAQTFYNETDPLAVFELETDNGARYDVRGFVDFDGLTFEELQAQFEELHDALEEE